MSVEHRVQIADLRALAGDEAELFQGFFEEYSNVLLAVGDAGARRDSSTTECGEPGGLVDSLMVHDAPS